MLDMSLVFLVAKTALLWQFTSKTAIQKSAKKWSIFYIPHIELIYYHFIHFDQFGNVVILNDGNQFKSFEKTVQSDLHQKPGGELNLTFKKNDNDYLFNLTRKGFDGKSSVRTIAWSRGTGVACPGFPAAGASSP